MRLLIVLFLGIIAFGLLLMLVRLSLLKVDKAGETQPLEAIIIRRMDPNNLTREVARIIVEDNQLVHARRGDPLVIGRGDDPDNNTCDIRLFPQEQFLTRLRKGFRTETDMTVSNYHCELGYDKSLGYVVVNKNANGIRILIEDNNLAWADSFAIRDFEDKIIFVGHTPIMMGHTVFDPKYTETGSVVDQLGVFSEYDDLEEDNDPTWKTQDHSYKY